MLQELNKLVFEAMDKKQVKGYIDKFEMKMFGSALGTAVGWVDGTNRSDEEKTAILKGILSKGYINLKTGKAARDDLGSEYGWADKVLSQEKKNIKSYQALYLKNVREG